MILGHPHDCPYGLRRVLEAANKIAKKAHRGQKRWGGEPYITHPRFVASKFPNCLNCQIVAILHDVIEDTEVTAKDLLDANIPDNLVDAVIAISKIPCEDYLNYLLRVKDNVIATNVKIEDLRHNLSDLKKGGRRDKYLLSLYILGARE